MKIAQVSDLHLFDGLANHFQIDSEKNVETIFNDIIKENVDLIVFTGDLGSLKGIEFLNKKLNELNTEYLVVLGNHDNIDLLIEYNLIKNVESTEQIVRFTDCNVILVNSSNGFINNAQIEMITHNIELNKQNILFSHFPLIETNKTVLDKELGVKNNNQNHYGFLDKKLDIFTGHYHCANEITLNNIRQIICPAAIMQINEKDNKIITESFNFGYNVIEVKKNRINYQTKMFPGNGVNKAW